MTQTTPPTGGTHCVVGYVPESSGDDAVALGRMLTSGTSDPLTVCTVIANTATGGDAAFGSVGYGDLMAEKLKPYLEQVKADLAPIEATCTVCLATSVATGLLDYCAERGGTVIALGSARNSVSGRYAVGSMAGLLQHASPIPLAFAPAGFAHAGVHEVHRVVCGYNESPDSEQALRAAVALSRAHDAPLQIVYFVFPEHPGLRHLAGRGSHDPSQAHQNERAAQLLATAANAVPDDVAVETFVRTGGNVAQAVARAEWADGDLLVLGSAPMGPLARVFLGSTALKLIRCCPVPVVAVPRHAESASSTHSSAPSGQPSQDASASDNS